MRTGRIGQALAVAALLASCAPRPAPPAPVPAPPASQPSAPTPPAPPPDWEAAPLSGGDWTYGDAPGEPVAEFRSGTLAFSLRCRGGGMIALALAGASGASLRVRTTYGERRLASRSGPAVETEAMIAASDPLLDQIAFSRGRFLAEAEGGVGLIMPSWPEPARAIEQCRG